MRVTRVTISMSKDPRVLAYATLVLDDQLIIRNIRIIRRPDSRRMVLMPSRQGRSGEYADMVHPVTVAFRSYLEAVLLRRIDELTIEEPSATRSVLAGGDHPPETVSDAIL